MCVPAGATRLIRPAVNASSAVKKRPVSATSVPNAPAPRKCIRPQYLAAPRPRGVSVIWNLVPASATIRSDSSTMPTASPRTYPCGAAMTGFQFTDFVSRSPEFAPERVVESHHQLVAEGVELLRPVQGERHHVVVAHVLDEHGCLLRVDLQEL